VTNTRPGVLRARTWVIFLLVCWWAFAFRLARPDFTNDDFDHLSKARQVLFGELPDRDFYDDGRPLTIAASAAAQWVSPTLLSEFVLRAGALAVGAAIVFALAAEITQSAWLGLAAAHVTIAMRARLYNYPKILIFPLGVWVLWRYIDRPTPRGRWILGAATVAAFLFRYDFGVYLAAVFALSLVCCTRPLSARPLVAYLVSGLVLVSPYLGWLALNGRLLSTGTGGFGSMLSNAPGFTRAPLHLDFRHGPFVIEPPPPQLGVRWASGVDADTRSALEKKYRVLARGTKLDGRTVSYFAEDTSPASLQAIVHDPHVEDTSGIDRNTGALQPQPWLNRLVTWVPLLRVRVAPMIPSSEAAQGWIYDVFFLAVPLGVILVLIWPAGLVTHEKAKVLSLATLCALLHQFLVQGNLDSRLPDVVAPTSVLLAWLAARALAAMRGPRGLAGWTRSAVVVAVLASIVTLTAQAISIYSERSLPSVVAAGFTLPSSFEPVVKRLGQRPIDYWAVDRGDDWVNPGTHRNLTRYIARCVAPSDRPLVVGYSPEVYYVSERLFPGGINKFDASGFNPSSVEIMRRLRRQSVPLVVVDEAYREFFESEWPELAAYVATRYKEAGVSRFGGQQRMHVLVDPVRPPQGTDPEWNLPCYGTSSS
jgi:hypothetical protein